MIRTIVLAAAILVLTHGLSIPVLAAVSDVNVLKQRWYGLRYGTALGSGDAIFYAPGGAGVWSYDPLTMTWVRLHPLIYGDRGFGQGAAVTAKEDTLVVQGTTFLEFELSTNRLLRRSAALAHADWAFGGEYVALRVANMLGISPGYYGFIYCPPGQGPLGFRCGPTEFPGQDKATDATIGNHFYHRATDYPTLSLLTVLPSGPVGVPGLEGRSTALDAGRRRFWYMRRYPQSAPPAPDTIPRFEFGYLPITSGAIGAPLVVEQQDSITRTSGTDLLYDALRDALIAIGWGSSVAQRPADLSGPEVFVPTNAGGHAPSTLTMVAPGLPETYEQILPAIGNGPGAFGTYWRSDAWMYNPAEAPTTVTVRRVAQPSVIREYRIPAHGSIALQDILRSLGGGPAELGGDGTVTDAVVVTSPYQWGEQVVAFSRNYTNAPDGRGSYGQAIPAVPSRVGYSTHLPHASMTFDTHAEPPEFILDLRKPGAFRHNLGAVNDSDETLVLDLYYGYPIAAPSGEQPTRTVIVPPHTVLNTNVEALIPAEMLMTRAAIVKIAGSRPAPVWVSMIDNTTGDATFYPFAVFSLMGARDSTIAIPQIAHTPGANGTFWRSDLVGRFLPPVTSEQLPQVTFYPGDPLRCGGQPSVAQTLVGPDGRQGNSEYTTTPSVGRRIFPDVVQQLTGCVSDGTMGALEINAGSWMTGFTRTYTTRSDGGTYGDLLPFFPSGGWPVQHFAGVTINDQVRINIGLYNGLDYPVTHDIIAHDETGKKAGTATITLAPRRSQQTSIGALLPALPHGLYGITINPQDVSNAQPGKSWAYIAVVDNGTGDTTNLW